MKNRDMERFAELAQDFYQMKQDESGMVEPVDRIAALLKGEE